MKRRTSLLLVGLSLTSASVALAAPPARKPVRVAQGASAPAPEGTPSTAPTDPAAPGAPATPAPSSTTTTTTPPPAAPADTNAAGGTSPEAAPAPAPEAAPATAPASSSGTGFSFGASTNPPGADQPQEAEPAPEAPPKPRPWAGTSIFGMTDMSTSTVFRGQQQYDNPTASGSLYFLPRYNVSDSFQLRGRLIFNYEYTNSDDTVSRNEPRFGDASLMLYYKKIPTVLDFKPMVALSLMAPTSPESRARTMIVTPGLLFQASRMFEQVLGSDLLVLATAGYSHPIYESQTPEIRGAYPYSPACIGGGTDCVRQLSGRYNASDILTYGLLIAPTWGKVTPALYYLGSSQWAYQGKQNVTTPEGYAVTTPDGFDPTNLRQQHYFSAWVDYEFNTWLTGEIGYYMSRAALTEAGKYGNPFFDRYQDTRVYLGANVSVDNLVQEIMGAGEGAAGIPRAQNTRRPMWSF